MKIFMLFTFFVACFTFELTPYELNSIVAPPCPCPDASHCKPVTAGPRKELFIFHMPSNAEDVTYLGYDYSKVTTIVNFSYFPNHTMDMLCLAHSHNVRVYPALGGFSQDLWANSTARRQFVVKQLSIVVSGFYDGINIDIEDAVSAGRNASLLTLLTSELHSAFKSYNNNFQVTYDVAWSPDCIDERCYDYLALSKVTDLFFVMAYDMRSQIFDDCVASANTPSALAQHGMKRFLEIGVPNNKLVLGLPWYGYDYPCIQITNTTAVTCPIVEVPFRGVACSDAAGRQRSFDDIVDIFLPKSTTGRRWDSLLQSPWFNYVDDKKVIHQVWYDDVQSLGVKISWAKKMNLRGVGMWEADYVSLTNPKRHKEMWGAFAKFFS